MQCEEKLNLNIFKQKQTPSENHSQLEVETVNSSTERNLQVLILKFKVRKSSANFGQLTYTYTDRFTRRRNFCLYTS